jgi:hypothetical protein
MNITDKTLPIEFVCNNSQIKNIGGRLRRTRQRPSTTKGVNNND